MEEFHIQQKNIFHMKQRNRFFETLSKCCKECQGEGGPNGNYQEAAVVAKRIAKNVRLYFKDQTIRQISHCIGVPDQYVASSCTIEEAFRPMLNKKNLYAFSKENVNDHHTSSEDRSVYKSKKHDWQLFEYIDIQRDSDRPFEKSLIGEEHVHCEFDVCPPFKHHQKAIWFNDKVAPALRTVAAFPNPLNLIENNVFEMKSINSLQDLNCQSLGAFLSHQHIREFIVHDCTLTDLQLSYLLKGASHNNMLNLHKIEMGGTNCEIGPLTIEAVKSILLGKQGRLEAQRLDTFGSKSNKPQPPKTELPLVDL